MTARKWTSFFLALLVCVTVFRPRALLASNQPAEITPTTTSPVTPTSITVASTTMPASTSTPVAAAGTPVLIVWAHTDLQNPGVLDVVDLERYFVERLADVHVENVVPSTTAKSTARPGPANLYLLDLSVDALQLASRVRLGGTDDPVFSVELSLAVKHLQSGRVIGATVERSVYHLSTNQQVDRNGEEKSAIYRTADRLFGRFVDEWAAGKFADVLPSAQAPLSLPFWLSRHIREIEGATGTPIWLLGMMAGLGLFFLLVVIHIAWEESRRPASPNAVSPDVRVAWNRELKEAFAVALETDNFSEPACRAAAETRPDDVLGDHASITAKEAERRVTAKDCEQHYQDVAGYAAATLGMDKNQVLETLRKVDAWPYRVLQEAQKIATEATGK